MITLISVRAAAIAFMFWLGIACAAHAQNTNQVLGQVDFDAKANIDKSPGVWVDCSISAM